VIYFGFALLGGAIGRYFGKHAWGALRRLRLGAADSAFGAIVAVVAALAAVWLIALLLTAGPTPTVARAVNDSAIVRALTDRLPPAPSVFTRLQAFINTTPFPRVFEGLEPVPAGPVNMPSDPSIAAARRGAGGAVLGYPGGGGFAAGPAAVLREFAAVGRDIYGRSLTHRNVYQLQATIKQGNSGGPFVRRDGTVLGVVFAASTSDPN